MLPVFHKNNFSDELKRGITLIELLVVIAIITIIAASSTPFLSSFLLRNRHQTALERTIGSLRQAQSYAMAGKNNSSWGVCAIGQKIRMYENSCSSPSYKEDFDLVSSISISGLGDISFDSRGETQNPSSINISTNITSDTISANSVGRIQID